jgi:hypothetical protein
MMINGTSGALTAIGIASIATSILTTPHIWLDIIPGLIGAGLMWAGGYTWRLPR